MHFAGVCFPVVFPFWNSGMTRWMVSSCEGFYASEHKISAPIRLHFSPLFNERKPFASQDGLLGISRACLHLHAVSGWRER